MKAELQNYLVKKYPEFFEYLKDYKGPLMPITFGFECGDGWFPILEALMANIKNHIENENRNRKNRFRHKFPQWIKNKAYWRISHKRKYLRKFLIWIADRFPKGVDPMAPIDITQVKEKFGGLRFYYNGGDDYIDGLESMAESMSYRTCEFCGATKDVGHTQGWVITCCKTCLDTNENLKNRVWKPIKLED